MKKYKELSYQEKLAGISLYSEEVKKDEDWDVRMEAYRALGFYSKSLKEEDGDIRRQAYLYFKIKNGKE